MAAEVDPPTTPWEIREAIRRELAWYIDDQRLDGTPMEDDVEIDESYGQGVATLRDLCAALESIDRVAFNAQQASVGAPPFDIEVLAVQLWNATQDAGASTDVGDAVVAELRKCVGG